MANKYSSSSSVIAGRTSPSSRNSESGNPMRRSFAGNPFTKPSIVTNPRNFNPITPANSPADHPRRNSISKEHLEEKENDKDQNSKPSRIRTPTTVTKSPKHFMSPTISAASKIAVSPKTKILGDRNEPLRTSISFSDTEIAPISNPTIVVPPPKTSKTVRFSGFEVISDSTESILTEESDCVNFDPSFKISPVSSPIAPLDADPLPPYDPQNNYLSPRPQFLHYKPNPRIERYLRKEPDGTKLEDFFISDSEFTDETESEYSQKESDGEVKEEEEKEVKSDDTKHEDFFFISDSEFTDETKSENTQKELDEETEEEEEKEVEVKEVDVLESFSKPESGKRTKIGALFLVLLIASFSSFVVNNVYDSNVLERPRVLLVEDSLQIYEFAKMNYNGLIGKLEVWRANSVSFVSDLVFDMGGMPPLSYFNTSDFYEDVIVNEQCLVSDQRKSSWEEEKAKVEREEIDIVREESESGRNDIEEAIAEEEEEMVQEIEAIIDVASDELEVEENSEESVAAEVKIEEEEKISPLAKVTDEEEKAENHVSLAAGNVDVHESNVEFEYQPSLISQSQSDVEQDLAFSELTGPETEDETDTRSHVEENHAIMDLARPVTDTESRYFAVMSALLVVFPLITLAGLVFLKRVGLKSSIPVVEEKQQPLLNNNKNMSHNPEEEEGHIAGESCSSEMSSFQYSTSENHGHGRKKRNNNNSGSVNNSRRESMASSMEEYSVSASPSYGSFTTYERIPIKHGNGEEETVTPVRRSSRIRKQVTSP